MHDIIVLSDLHIGRGRNPETGRYHSLETFFYDEDLRRFCRKVCTEAASRGVTVKFVFNGDTFDFLRSEAEEEIEGTRREQRFGPDLTPEVAARAVSYMLAGHPVFAETLGEILEAGHEIVFLPGNHDNEVQWEPVQSVVRDMVRRRLRTPVRSDEVMARLKFEPWFVYEPGRIWIEHGCQYDPECAFRFPLRGAFSQGLPDPKLLERDVPLGNFIQRYLYNAFGPITFIVPSTRANARYTRWLLLHEPRLLFRVVFSHIPFIFQVLRRLSQAGSPGRETLQKAHDAQLASLSTASGLGETLKRIDELKNVQGDLVQTVRQQGLQAIRFLLLCITVAVSSAGLWFFGWLAITELQGYGFGAKSMLFIMLNSILMLSVFMGLGYLVLKSAPSTAPTPLKRGAQELVNILDVPVVTFGHTHDEVIWRLNRPSGGKAWYFNTGTWIAVFTDDVLLPRERVQYTFLRMRGLEGDLLHWSPGRDESLPVILLDELTDDTALVPAPVPHAA